MKVNGKYGRIKLGVQVIGSISAWTGSLDIPTEKFDALGSDGEEVMFLEATNLSVSFDGLRDIGDAAQDAIFGNVVKVNSGTPDSPGTDTPPAYGLATLELYETDTRCWAGSFAITPEGVGAEKGKMTAFKAKGESSGGVTLYTGDAS